MSADGDYRVLARKYRPASFSALIGQDTLVKTLRNAIESGRLAHAFMLTGVRGVGKTTTARLIARALNCIGPDGTGQPTMEPCGVCDSCRSIAEDRHPDVIEMDAASRTGVDDVRELIESVRYRPVSARFKIYIIDEVHMLSRQAFNALLKTLEEPPPDIKFVFATTEINKVPITVLSRCQRYTLPRIPAATLAGYFGEIAGRESVEIDGDALALIARAADGSVRDGLSILDQAIALALGNPVTGTAVRDMLGVADRSLTLDLFERVMSGDAPAALAQLEALYDGGTDPAMVVHDLLEITHALTRLKFEPPGSAPAAAATELGDRPRAQALAQKLGVGTLTRAWQILLKGLHEVQAAPQPVKAAEMLLVRLIHARDLPAPADLLKLIEDGGPIGTRAGGLPAAPPGAGRPMALAAGAAPLAVAAPAPINEPTGAPTLACFADVLALAAERRAGMLAAQLDLHAHLVDFKPGRIEFRAAAGAQADLAPSLARFLEQATGTRWLVTLSHEPGAPTPREQRQARDLALRIDIAKDPLVAAILAGFPGARIESVIGGAADPLPPEPAPMVMAEADAEPPPDLYDPEDPGPLEE